MSDSQHSPVAIVTGAASGIGLEVSKMLLSKGYLVAMADWNETRGAEQVQELGPRTMFLKCNVADWNSHAAVFEATKKLWGRVDVYAANAGIADGYEPHVHVESDPDGIYYRQELAFHSKSAAWHESEEGAKVWQAAGSLKQEPES